MSHEEQLNLCRQWEEAFFLRRDLRALAELYSEDAVVESPIAGTLTGREAVLDAHNTVFASFPDMVWTSETALVDDERAAIVGEAKGTYTGTIMGLPATGRPYRIRMVFLLDIRDGHIVRDRRVYDFTGLLVQVGVMKAKPV